MKGNKYGFYVALGAMILFALVAVTGIIIFFAGAATFPVYISLISVGVGGVLISFALTVIFVPKNKNGNDPAQDKQDNIFNT